MRFPGQSGSGTIDAPSSDCQVAPRFAETQPVLLREKSSRASILLVLIRPSLLKSSKRIDGLFGFEGAVVVCAFEVE